MPEHLDAFVSMRTEGVSVLVDLTRGRLPALVHWGAELDHPNPSDYVALIEAGVQPVGINLVDEPVRLSLVPEHWTGWVGRPGISASLAGGQRSVTHSAPVVDLSPALNARAGSGRAAKRHE